MMASPSSNVLPIPRLRLSRRSEGLQTPGAGPSNTRRYPDSTSDTHSANNAIEGNSSNGSAEDDEQPTPKPANAYLDSAETPAARLRAVLSRIPDPNRTPIATSTQPLPPPEHESQYDMDSVGQSEAPSFAQKSIKDIFTRALREPGSTPRKAGPGRFRRNSVDVSEMENSPMAQQEKEKMKGKQKSLSDEELDAAKSAPRSEASYKSSSASTFDILRERLNNSHTQIKDQHLPNSLFAHEVSDTDSVHGGYILGNSADISTTPAMSSFRESFRMNMNSKNHSNLMGDDTTMQRAMDGFATSDAESDMQSQGSASAPPVPFPSSKQGKRGKQGKKIIPDSLTHGRPQQRPRSLSAAKQLAGLLSVESSLHHSSSGSKETTHLHELERKWNKPVTPHRPDTPEQHHHSTHSHTGLRRHSSTYSLSSSTSSVASNGEATVKQKNRLLEREHSWNKPQPRLSRPTSSLSLRSPEQSGHRSRKISLSSLTDLGRRVIGRADSFSSSRASSPAHSLNDVSYDGSEYEALHERERNWNANRPRWEHQDKLRSPPHQTHEPGSPSTVRPAPRVRAESLQSAVAKKMNTSIGHISPQPSPSHNGNGRHLRSPSSSGSPSRIPKLSSTRPHSFYGSPSSTRHSPQPPSRSPISSLRLGSRPRASSPSLSTPAYHRQTSPQSPKPSLAELRRSLEPPQSNDVDTDVDTDTEPEINIGMPNGHIPQVEVSDGEKSQDEPLQEELSEDHIEVSQHLLSRDDIADELHESDFAQEEEEIAALPPVIENDMLDIPSGETTQENTPVVRPNLELSPPASPPPMQKELPSAVDQTVAEAFESAQSAEEESAPETETEEPSPIPPPPESPSRAETSFRSVLATPPRPSFNASKVDFHIPTPPRNLPDLPDPPSSSEDDFGKEDNNRLKTPDTTMQQGNLTAMKTPKPPGAWFATPAQPKRVSNNVFDSPPKSLRTPIHELKTPRPPGAYIPTPAPAGHAYDPPSDSSIEPEHTFARTTIGRTPAPPGAYFATPAAAKKSMLKVRFDTHGDSTDMSSNASSDITPTAAPTPSSTGRKAGVRILDAYGREVTDDEDAKQPIGKGKARAIEPEVTDDSEVPAEDTWEHIDNNPMDRFEALARVRQGLSELAEGLEELDNSGLKLDRARIEELKELSSQAQEARQTVSKSLEERDKLLATNGSLRSRLQTTGMGIPKSYLFWAFVVLQLAIVLFMYRASVQRAKEIYLTTYLDPFYPYLYLHPRRVGSVASPQEAALSMAEKLRLEGWRASITNILDISSKAIRDSQVYVWETFGKDGAPRDASWPPT